MTNYDLKVISLGAGTQSSAMLMLALRGELPDYCLPLDAAIFADTGDEPQAVYDYLDMLREECDRYGVPLRVVQSQQGPLSEQLQDTERKWLPMAPVSTQPFDDWSGRPGRASRHCTTNVKVQVIRAETRRLLGVKTGRGKRVLEMMGMSADEADRIKPADVQWIERAWPLALDLGWKRQDSIDYLESLGMPDPPRSACVYCPLRSNAEWRELRDNHPADFKEAVRVDYAIREANRKRREAGVDHVPKDIFVHRQGVPLDEADLDIDNRGQQTDLCGEVCMT